MGNSDSDFIGRKSELKALNQLLQSRTANLVVIKGRRRIGKSRLVEEFAQNMKFLHFSALPPTPETTLQFQINEFSRQLGDAIGVSGISADDWSPLLTLLAHHTKKGRVLILLDEISWMASKDPNFLGKLKIAWDKHFKKNPKLILVLCGSVSSWIEKNILSHTGYLGRPSLYIQLEQMPLSDCNLFWMNQKGISSYEKFKVLSLTGGVPRYLELIYPALSAEENIRRLCFSKTGVLVKEFKYIFSDIFGKRSETYKKIVTCLVTGTKDLDGISQCIGLKKSGAISEYLNDLMEAGFVAKDYSWHLKTGALSKFFHYRLSDNYLRFYLKYIHPNLARIEKGIYSEKTLATMPAWESIMGLQFENLVTNNHDALIKALGLRPEEIIFGNPFFQKPTTKNQGCQIDYMIQTSFNCLYICEIKFSKHRVKPSVISEMQAKISRIKLPGNFSYRPVLIHINGAHPDIEDSGVFAHIVDFSHMLA